MKTISQMISTNTVTVQESDELTNVSLAKKTGVKERLLGLISKGIDGPSFVDSFEPAGQTSTFAPDGGKSGYAGPVKGLYPDLMDGFLPKDSAGQCKLLHSLMIDLAESKEDVLSADRAFLSNMFWVRRAYKSSYAGVKTTTFKCAVNSYFGLKNPLKRKTGRAYKDEECLLLYESMLNSFDIVKKNRANLNMQPIKMVGEKRVVFDYGFLSRVRVDGKHFELVKKKARPAHRTSQ